MKSQERDESCPQTCAVCGNAATGFHYQAAACNRCKAFFRRAVTGMKQIDPCLRAGGCLLAKNNVAIEKCRACRFSRCIEGGMNPFCIDSEIPPEDNPVIQQALELRRDRASDPSPSQTPVLDLQSVRQTAEAVSSRLIEELAFLEVAHEKIRRSSFSPAPEDGIPLADLIRGHSKLAHDFGDLTTASFVQPSISVPDADALWSCIETRMESAIPAIRKEWACLKNFYKVWPHADLVYAIEYFKTFEVFHRLNEEEKLQLVRWVVAICAHFTVSYFSYKMKKSVTYHPDGSTVRMKCVVDTPQKIEFHLESIKRIRELDVDEKEYVLLKAMIVSDPTIDGLSDYGRSVLEDQRAQYAKSLLSYMNAKRGPHKAPAQFLEMLRLIDWFRSVNEKRKSNSTLPSTFSHALSVVCGDAATGYHYQTAACNRCKAFFRRSVLGMKLFAPCHKDGACLRIENMNVKQCRACRFARCVEGGMNPLCIDSAIPPEENPVVQEVLRIRNELQMCALEPSASEKHELALELSPKTVEMVINRLIDELSFLEMAHEKLRRSRYSPMPEDGIPLAELIRGHSKLAFDYGDLPSGSEEQKANTCAGTDALWNCVEPSPTSCSPKSVKKWACLQQFRKIWPHADLVYAIEYLKTFEVFHRLDDDDKLLLARWVVAMCAHLTVSYFSFKMKSSITHHPDGSTLRSTCVMDTPQKIEYHFESIDRIRALEMDEKEYVLLKAIIICDPTLEGLSEYGRGILDEARSRYAKSLFSYMNAHRGTHKAPRMFMEMLKLIDWFRSVNEKRKEHHLLRTMTGVKTECCRHGSEERPLLEEELFL